MDSKKDIFATREGKQDFIIAVIVIAIFSILIYYFAFNSSDEVMVHNPVKADAVLTEVKPVSEKAEELYYSYASSSTNKATTIQVVDGYESESNTATVVSDIIKSTPIIADKNSEPINNNETILLYENQKRRIDSIANIKEEKQSVVPTKKVITETKIPAATEKIKNTAIPPNKTLNCVVVVGVFKEAANKARVIAKLNSLGHTHSEGILRENISYVGVPVNCENTQMREKLLNDLNKAFGIDSWVKKL